MAYKSGARAGACDVDREPASFAMRQYVLLPSLVRVAPETKPKSEWGSADRRELRERNFSSGELPILFCSPTMELGVDIKDLSVVHMRNVPPTPAKALSR